MSIFFIVIAVANYYVSARLFSYAPIPQVHFLVPLIVALAFFLLEIIDIRTTFLQTSPVLKFMISVTTGTFFSLILYVFLADLILLGTRLMPDMFPYVVMVKSLFWAIVAVTVTTVGIGAFQALKGPQIKEVSVSIANLPPSFEGYKILQITDLHMGGTIRKSYVENVVEMANNANADLIALTGDFADGLVKDLMEEANHLGDLKSKDGIYFVTGNHEYYHDLPNWRPLYESMGFRILSNRHEVIEKGGDKLVVAGVTDYSTLGMTSDERTDIAKAANGMPEDAVKLLLMHQPTMYKEAADAGFDLQLSGHTHGGQFFPWTLTIPFFHDFYKGLGRYKDLQVYVSVGTGYWGPALRTFNPTEITVLTLTKGE